MSILLVAAGLVAGARAVSAEPPEVLVDPQQAVLNDIAHLARQLADVSLTQSQREEAARRLVVRGHPEGRRVLLDVLADERNADGQLAVARALAAHPTLDPGFIDPLFAVMAPNRQRATEAAGQALSAYKTHPTVFARLKQRAESGQQDELIRITAIRALGTFVEKSAAQALVELIQKRDEKPVVVQAAMDALADMTTLREHGRDMQAWLAWWQEARAREDSAFKDDLLVLRAVRHDQMQRRHVQFAQEVQGLLREQYLATPEANRVELLLRYMRASDPEIRLVGARIIQQEAVTTRGLIPPAALERLREMAGDSSPAVRLEVVRALHSINDPQALGSLLTQLAQEPEGEIRSAIALAVAPMGDLRAVPALLRLLNDRSAQVAESAARALREMGPSLREQDRGLSARTARELQAVVARTAAPGSELALRRAAVEAMVPLRDPAVFQTFAGLLGQGEVPAVRVAAVAGLGELRDPRVSDAIVRALDDPADAVRLEAVMALGKISTADHAEALYRRLDSREERNERVRDQAWLVLESLFPHFPDHQLSNWADRFQDQPNRRLTVLLALASNLQAANRTESLAIVQQNIGETYLQLENPSQAAGYFKLALDYWAARQAHVRTEGLIQQRMTALLRSGQYTEAIQFAADSIAADPSQQQTMGVLIVREAERLRDRERFEEAQRLIELARNMRPALAELYLENLMTILRDIERQREQQELAPNRGGGLRSVETERFPHLTRWV